MTTSVAADPKIEALEHEIRECELRLDSLKQQLAEAKSQSISEHETIAISNHTAPPKGGIRGALDDLREENADRKFKWPLHENEYKRYGRQLIMPEVGLQGQLRLKKTSVLIVGAGGLGCPAAAYIAGAGVKTIGFTDGDTVEESNLHRQILHNTERLGMSKVDSAITYLKALNPNVQYVPYKTRLSPDNAVEIFKDYDLVLDCTDTPASRYLISDTCVLLGKPLVSASALRTEGQLMVLNYPALPPGEKAGGPCYRCIFPKPPPPESVLSCGEGGILGPVVGVMGVLQALEAIKLITKGLEPNPMSTRTRSSMAINAYRPSMLLFSAYGEPQFRSIKMRSRKLTCAACSSPEAAKSLSCMFQAGSMDYVQFCGAITPVNALSPSERVSPREFARLQESIQQDPGHMLVDVREKVQFDLCSLDNSINIPYSEFAHGFQRANADEKPTWIQQLEKEGNEKPIYVLCRLGNDSQLAVRKIKEAGLDFGGNRYVGDVAGGLHAWKKDVDPTFPEY